MAILGEELAGGTEAEAAIGRFFDILDELPQDGVDITLDAIGRLGRIFTGDADGEEADRLYRTGRRDVLRHRDTPEADFYVRLQPVIEAAAMAHDRPKQ